ncbi:MAG: hypothetical protein AB7N24_03640 [Dehalococcoidia bacterium]
MAMFWLWGVRNLFVALAAVTAFAGYKEVADWSITLVVMLGFAFIAEIGNRFGRRALNKKRRKQAAIAALRSASELRERMRGSHEQQRAA